MYIQLLLLVAPFITVQAGSAVGQVEQKIQTAREPCLDGSNQKTSLATRFKNFWLNIKDKIKTWWETFKYELKLALEAPSK